MVAMATPVYWFPVNRTDSANNMLLIAKLLHGHSAEGSNGHKEEPYICGLQAMENVMVCMSLSNHSDCNGCGCGRRWIVGSCQWEMQWHTKSTNTMGINETYPCDISRQIVANKYNFSQHVIYILLFPEAPSSNL